jgi:plasmid replication initiation protein
VSSRQHVCRYMTSTRQQAVSLSKLKTILAPRSEVNREGTMDNARAEYDKLTGLLNGMDRISASARAAANLRDADLNTKANASNAQAMDSLERNLTNMRRGVLSELLTLIEQFKG